MKFTQSDVSASSGPTSKVPVETASEKGYMPLSKFALTEQPIINLPTFTTRMILRSSVGLETGIANIKSLALDAENYNANIRSLAANDYFLFENLAQDVSNKNFINCTFPRPQVTIGKMLASRLIKR